MDLSQLSQTRKTKGEEEVSVLPCLAISLHSDLTLSNLAPFIGEAINKYLEFIPVDTLRSVWVGDQMKKLTRQKLKKDLRILAALPDTKKEFYLLYSQGKFGAPGTNGVIVFANEFETGDEHRTNYLRLELPYDSAEGDQVNSIIALVKNILEDFPYSVGSVGFGFSFHLFDRFARKQVNAMLPRYLGFDASSEYCRFVMRNRSLTAHWINILSNKELAILGGRDALESAITDDAIIDIKAGVMIRGAKYPPVADINSSASDIGHLPSVADFMRETRFRMWKFRWAEADQVDKWLERFDELQSKDWNNR